MSTQIGEDGPELAEESQDNATPIAQGEAPGRSLLPWLDDATALMHVLGRPAQQGEDTSAAMAIITAARRARAARAPWSGRDPRVAGFDELLATIGGRADIATLFAPYVWEPAVVDLRQVLSVQQVVNDLPGLDARVAGAPTDPQGLTDICLPQTTAEPLHWSVDPDNMGFTVSSANPNLQITGSGVGAVALAPGDTRQAIQVFVGVAASFLQVASYRDRYFLRDGYHRAVGLLRRGIAIVPAVFIHARTLGELTPGPGLFGENVLFDERPPSVTDFLDDAVAHTRSRPLTRKFIRVRADQFGH